MEKHIKKYSKPPTSCYFGTLTNYQWVLGGAQDGPSNSVLILMPGILAGWSSRPFCLHGHQPNTVMIFHHEKSGTQPHGEASYLHVPASQKHENMWKYGEHDGTKKTFLLGLSMQKWCFLIHVSIHPVSSLTLLGFSWQWFFITVGWNQYCFSF